MKKKVLINFRKLSELKNKKILKDVLFLVAVFLFGLVVIFMVKHTNIAKFWKRTPERNPIDRHIEQKGKERLELYSEYMSNKKEVSRKVRLDLLVAINRFNKICKKYLTPSEYNIYLMLDYISECRKMTKDENLMQLYLFEKVRRSMTPEEEESVYKEMEVLERLKEELKEIQAKKQENK